MAAQRSDFDKDGLLKKPTQFLMLNCLLLTQVEEAEVTDAQSGCREDHRFEEEVSSYLENLLRAFSDPPTAEHLKPYLFDYDIEVMRRLETAEDVSVKYMIATAERDLLIVAVAVFEGADQADVPSEAEFKHGTQGQMGRGQSHYHFAFSYSNKVVDAKQAVASLLGKFSIGLEKYTTILSYVTNGPVDVAAKFANADIYHLARSVATTGRHIRLEYKQNEFLDAYLEWRQRRTEDAKQRVLSIADELREMDPTFSYTPEA
ncbi:MAG: hypothetical protein V1694_12560 [Candidatus Eisenbacteria bacterium]